MIGRWIDKYPVIVTKEGERYIGYGKYEFLSELAEEYPDMSYPILIPEAYTAEEVLTALQGELENWNRHSLMIIVEKFYDKLVARKLPPEEIKAVLLDFGDAYFELYD